MTSILIHSGITINLTFKILFNNLSIRLLRSDRVHAPGSLSMFRIQLQGSVYTSQKFWCVGART